MSVDNQNDKNNISPNSNPINKLEPKQETLHIDSTINPSLPITTQSTGESNDKTPDLNTTQSTGETNDKPPNLNTTQSTGETNDKPSNLNTTQSTGETNDKPSNLDTTLTTVAENGNADIAHSTSHTNTPLPSAHSHNIRANQYACCANPKTVRLEEFNFCKKKIHELKLPMRLIQTSFLQEDNRLVFFFTAPERVDFRELLRALRQKYYGIRIELRQIGQRDAASLLGGIGICGQELCCCKFLRAFSPITAKIAKKVGPTPNPAMYCGICGRLRCCLKYEEGVCKLLLEEEFADTEWTTYDQ